jgi:hypothetical protein
MRESHICVCVYIYIYMTCQHSIEVNDRADDFDYSLALPKDSLSCHISGCDATMRWVSDCLAMHTSSITPLSGTYNKSIASQSRPYPYNQAACPPAPGSPSLPHPLYTLSSAGRLFAASFFSFLGPAFFHFRNFVIFIFTSSSLCSEALRWVCLENSGLPCGGVP